VRPYLKNKTKQYKSFMIPPRLVTFTNKVGYWLAGAGVGRMWNYYLMDRVSVCDS
jgi:hypothetical protein